MTPHIRPAQPADAAVVFAACQRTGGVRTAVRTTWTRRRRCWARRCSARRRGFSATSPSGRGEVAGFALWFYNFSTFRGRHGIYLEDLFVRPAAARARPRQAAARQPRAGAASPRISPGWNGRCSTGTSPPSTSTRRRARSCWTAGRPAASPKPRCGGWPTRRGEPVMSLPVVIVVAAAENGVIGRDNGLIWRLKTDLRRFRALTLGRPLIMGRKTFQSIGKPLPGPRDHRADARSRVPAGGRRGWRTTSKRRWRWGQEIGRRHGGGQRRRRRAARRSTRRPCRMPSRIHLTRVHATPDGDAVFAPVDHGPFPARRGARSIRPARTTSTPSRSSTTSVERLTLGRRVQANSSTKRQSLR